MTIMNEIRDIHEPFVAWLRKLGIPYHRNRPDKRTTAIEGDPDFLVTWMQHCLYIECKVPGKKLSKKQEERIAYIRRAGNKVVIAYSLEECIDACKNILCVGKEIANTESLRSDTARSEVEGVAAPKGLGRAANEPLMQMPSDQGRSTPIGHTDRATLFIANVAGTDCVCRGSGQPGSEFEIVRRASPADLINLR